MAIDFSERVRQTFARNPAQRAIEFKGTWYSWGEIAAVADNLETALVSAGIPKGAPIGLAARNRVMHAAALLGLIAHARPITMIYAFQSPEALAKDIRMLRLAAVVADCDDWSELPVAASREAESLAVGLTRDAVNPVLFVDGETELSRVFKDLRSEPTIELLSSGTTGAPKRIPIKFSALTRAVASAVLGDAPQSDVPPQLMFWPISNVGGVCNLVTTGSLGTPMVLMEKFTVEEFAAGARNYRPPIISLTPAATRMILDAGVPPEDFAGIKAAFGGSAYLDPDLQGRFERTYGIPIYWGYGATEFCGSVIRWTPELRETYGASKRGSIGVAMGDVRIRVTDPVTGEEKPAGAEGLLEVQIESVDPEWLRTTDLVVVDQDGFVFHRGRNDGAIERGSFKILPETIVDVLRRHPAIADAAVVGLPDTRLGHVPAAAVELRTGHAEPTEDELAAHVRRHLPATHVPVTFLVVDALPRTPSMKVRVGEVRNLFLSPAG